MTQDVAAVFDRCDRQMTGSVLASFLDLGLGRAKRPTFALTEAEANRLRRVPDDRLRACEPLWGRA